MLLLLSQRTIKTWFLSQQSHPACAGRKLQSVILGWWSHLLLIFAGSPPAEADIRGVQQSLMSWFNVDFENRPVFVRLSCVNCFTSTAYKTTLFTILWKLFDVYDVSDFRLNLNACHIFILFCAVIVSRKRVCVSQWQCLQEMHCHAWIFLAYFLTVMAWRKHNFRCFIICFFHSTFSFKLKAVSFQVSIFLFNAFLLIVLNFKVSPFRYLTSAKIPTFTLGTFPSQTPRDGSTFSMSF